VETYRIKNGLRWRFTGWYGGDLQDGMVETYRIKKCLGGDLQDDARYPKMDVYWIFLYEIKGGGLRDDGNMSKGGDLRDIQ
jgi:hypothetical protein